VLDAAGVELALRQYRLAEGCGKQASGHEKTHASHLRYPPIRCWLKKPRHRAGRREPTRRLLPIGVTYIAEKRRSDFYDREYQLASEGEVGHLTGLMATLDDIVSAAAKVFRTKGYHAATVRDIADEVGILKGSLYHHFDSKEELLYLVVKEPIAQMYRTIGEIAAADGTATEKLRRAISAHLEAFDRHYPHLFVYLRERESVKRRFREMFGFSPKEYERCWQQIIREGVETGEFRAELDIQVASYGLLGMLNWLYKWYDPQGRLSVQEVAEQFTSLALAGLAAAPAAPRGNRTKPSP
jgi:AcrR family transcriptional regulator